MPVTKPNLGKNAKLYYAKNGAWVELSSVENVNIKRGKDFKEFNTRASVTSGYKSKLHGLKECQITFKLIDDGSTAIEDLLAFADSDDDILFLEGNKACTEATFRGLKGYFGVTMDEDQPIDGAVTFDVRLEATLASTALASVKGVQAAPAA